MPWEKVMPEQPEQTVHVHVKPGRNLRNPPGLGSVWRCSGCSATWEVIRTRGLLEAPSYALDSWWWKGILYYLSPTKAVKNA